MVDNLKRVVGDGLVFAEGDQWKQKRKVISQVFNFKFINSKIGDISKICLESIQKNEENCMKKGNCLSPGVYRSSIMDISGEFASEVIMQCFLGGKSSNETIDGISIAKFLIKLKMDVNIQSASRIGTLLGSKFLKLGLRSKDQEIN